MTVLKTAARDSTLYVGTFKKVRLRSRRTLDKIQGSFDRLPETN